MFNKAKVHNKGFNEGFKAGIIETLNTLNLIGFDIPEDETLSFLFDEMCIDRADRAEIKKELGFDHEDQEGGEA